MQVLSYVAIGSLVISILGCTTTDSNISADTLDTDIAIIRGASRATVLFSPTPVIIRKVDGKPVSGASSSVRVSPGAHNLLVTCYESLFAKNTHELKITVAAGNIYDLLTRIDPNKISDDTPDCEARLVQSDGK